MNVTSQLPLVIWQNWNEGMSAATGIKPFAPSEEAVTKTYPSKVLGLTLTVQVTGEPIITLVGLQDAEIELIVGVLPIVTVVEPALGPLFESPGYTAFTCAELLGLTSTNVIVHVEVVELTEESVQPGGA